MEDALRNILSTAKASALDSVTPQIQALIEKQTKDFILLLVNFVPPQEDLHRIGTELGNFIIEYIRTEVLNDIYYRVGESATLDGFEMSKDKKQEIYDKVIAKVPITKQFSVSGVTLTLQLQTIVKNSLTFDMFSKILDDALVFFSSVSETVKPEAISIAKRIGLGVALGGFVVGAACMYGFIRLYQSTTDAPFNKKGV